MHGIAAAAGGGGALIISGPSFRCGRLQGSRRPDLPQEPMFPESTMDLKIKELLNELRLPASVTKTLDQAVSFITDAIGSIPDQEVSSDAAPGIIRDLRVPADKVSFTFRSPASIQIGGSHSIHAVTKPDINVDLLVRMPKECFHEKDYLNHRYHAKRCLYLRVIEKSLKSYPTVRKMEWTTFQNEARKPILIVYPVMETAELSGFSIRIIPTATLLFEVSRLNISRNNVRAHSQGGVNQATPKYNSSILEDMFLEKNAEFVRNTFAEWKSLEEALILLKVWTRNRDSICMHDCINGYLISIIISYLASKSGGNCIKKSMNAMQIFQIVLKFIETSSLWDKGLTLLPLSQSNLSKEDITQYLQTFGVVLCDASGHFNMTFRMRREAFSELQDEATLVLNCIDKCNDGGFEEIFMTKVDFAAKFDSCMRINLKGNARASAQDFCLDDECWRTCEEDVWSLLQQGLSDRVNLIRVTWKNAPSDWNVDDGFSNFSNEPMLVGILLSSQEKSYRVVDVGPNAENKEEVAKFRKFWGMKAELRRFRDGTIAESTVWECELWERHIIIKKISEYVLSKHFLLLKEDIIHMVDQLDFCLLLGGKDPVSFSGGYLSAFDVLSKRLRLLDEIPLKVSSVQPLDAAFRHSSVFPPVPHPLAYEKSVDRKLPKLVTTCVQSLDVVIQLEGSGNWPLDSAAIEKTKSAFLLRIGESLQNKWGMFCSASENDVDVFVSGYSFRLKIMHERGLTLPKNLALDDSKKSVPSIDKELFICSQHSSMINGLVGRYPAYGPVVRLAKRWVSSHLFSSFLKEETVELIVAYLFIKQFQFHPPRSRITGFLRFLRILSSFNWTFSPMIVDINDDFVLKDLKEINDHFASSRKTYEENPEDVKPAMFLATTYDKASEAWTMFSPNRSVLKRMAAYARSSADYLTNLILRGQNGPYTWECLFRTPLTNYEALVLLHRDKLSYPERLLFPAEITQGKHVIRGNASKDFHPYMPLVGSLKSMEDARNKVMVNFEPTRYFLGDIKREFPDMFELWYDSLGSDVIGLTWGKKKRRRDEGDEMRREHIDMLKDVGEVGKWLVKSVYFLKAPKLQV